MTKFKTQGMASLRDELLAVARGERPAPADAGSPSFDSALALVRLLTAENRHLLATIRDREPGSVAELATMTGRAQPNLTRTLAKLKAAGLVTTRMVGRRQELRSAVKKIVVEIDPYSDHDRFRVG
jgi:predicted transcriptional regulator